MFMKKDLRHESRNIPTLRLHCIFDLVVLWYDHTVHFRNLSILMHIYRCLLVQFLTTIIYFGSIESRVSNLNSSCYKYMFFYRIFFSLMIKGTCTQRSSWVHEMDDVEEKFSSNIIKDWSSQAQGECNIAQTVVWTNKERHLWHTIFFISFIRNELNSNTLMVYLKFIIYPQHICNTYFEIRIC